MSRHEYLSLRQGLVGAWCPSLGASGLTLIDRSGLNNHGTLTNMAGQDNWQASGSGVTLQFDGSNDHCLVNHTRALDIPSSGTLTISAWVFRTANVADYETLLTKRLSSGATANYELSFNNTSTGNSKAFGFYSGSSFTVSTTLVPLLQWTHVGSVSTASGTTYYVDGRAGGTSATVAASPNTHPFKIGGVAGSPETQFLSARVDDIRVYSRALTLSEIRLLASRRGIGLQPLPDRSAGMPRKLFVNDAGTWRDGDAYVNTGSEWRLGIPSVNDAGTWR
jgi:hypothetical protein